MYTRETELFHHGVKGMHWGVRRYQNADGSYTAAGKEHYGIKGAVKNVAKKVTDATVYGKGGKVAKAVSKANYSMIGGAKKVSKVTGKISEAVSAVDDAVSNKVLTSKNTVSKVSSNVKTLVGNASSTAVNSLNKLTSRSSVESAKSFIESAKDDVVAVRNKVNSTVSTKIHQAQVKRKNS